MACAESDHRARVIGDDPLGSVCSGRFPSSVGLRCVSAHDLALRHEILDSPVGLPVVLLGDVVEVDEAAVETLSGKRS